MGLRFFTDSRGVHWTVWAVTPIWTDRRSGHDRRVVDLAQHERAEFDRAFRERRVEEERRGVQTAGIPTPKSGSGAGGWLAFDTQGERRRLAPIPDRWEELPEAELARLCAAAPLAPSDRGHVVE